jgi:hypothetical protein
VRVRYPDRLDAALSADHDALIVWRFEDCRSAAVG